MIARDKRHDGEITVGLIGCGNVVEGLHLPALISTPRLTIKWVCDSSIQRARTIARDWGVRRAFGQISDCPNVDVVLIATPVGTRGVVLEMTTERGWHALCEKPFATKTSEHHRILGAAERNGLLLGAGYMRRYFWAVAEARKMIRSNALGPLIEITASESAKLDRTGLEQSSYRNNTKASGGGVLMETGCHLIDEIMFVSDATGVEIHDCKQEVLGDYEVETNAFGSISHDSGEAIPLRFTISGIRPVFQGILLRCEKGEIHLSLAPEKGLEIFTGQARKHRLHLLHPSPAQQHVLVAIQSEWHRFLEAVQTVGQWDAHRETGLLTTDTITQCGEVANVCSLEVQ